MRQGLGFTFLNIVALAIAWPAAAAEYTPWVDRPASSDPLVVHARAKKGGGDSCCKHCTKGVPCGNSCIAANKTCKSPPGCAC